MRTTTIKVHVSTREKLKDFMKNYSDCESMNALLNEMVDHIIKEYEGIP